MPDMMRQWFVPGDGIDRHVISADIQRYLGNDATVRPGLGNGENQGVPGFWIKAYRNLTTAMISDLQQDSLRWRQEQAKTGNRGSTSPTSPIRSGNTVPDRMLEYSTSTTYNASSAGRSGPNARNSPSVTEGPYGIPTRDRSSVERMTADRMAIDPPAAAQAARGYPANDRPYPQEDRTFSPGNRNFMPPEGRYPYQDAPMQDYNPRVPVTGAYEQQPRYAPDYPGNNAPAGYVRQGDYMVPAPGQYNPNQGNGRQTGQYPPAGYNQPQPPVRGQREPGYAQADYQDPRYAYPSPAATTISTVPREPAASPLHAQSGGYNGNAGQPYDAYSDRPIERSFGAVTLSDSPATTRPSGQGTFGRPIDTARNGYADRRGHRT